MTAGVGADADAAADAADAFDEPDTGKDADDDDDDVAALWTLLSADEPVPDIKAKLLQIECTYTASL